jgi:ribose/xylose/arabinose/galactoside ABC-type transport system permease subunit
MTLAKTGLRPAPRARRLASALGQGWIILFLALEVIYFCFRSEGFASLNSLQIVLFYGVLVFLLATAELFVIITGGIDLSVGYVLGFASILSIKTYGGLAAIGLDPALALLLGAAAALAAGILPGLVNGILVSYLNVPPFIATFSMVGVCHGVSELIINGVYAMGLPKLASDIGTGHLL